MHRFWIAGSNLGTIIPSGRHLATCRGPVFTTKDLFLEFSERRAGGSINIPSAEDHPTTNINSTAGKCPLSAGAGS